MASPFCFAPTDANQRRITTRELFRLAETMKARRRATAPVAKTTAPDTAHAPSKPARTRRRMLASEREELILVEATRYFAEFGLSAGTIELARRIGMTQPLLYKYFPTKEALLVRIYERLFPQSWGPELAEILDDESLPLRERLTKFYQTFTATVLTYEHVRLFLFSGLTNNSLNARYYAILSEQFFTRIVRALRAEFLAKKTRRATTNDEMELVQTLHAAIYHVAFRRWVHGLSEETDWDALIALKIDFFLDGAAQTMKKIHAGAGGRPAKKSGAARADQ